MTILSKGGKVVQPGDFAAVRSHGDVGWAIRNAERLALNLHKHDLLPHMSKYDLNWEHAIFYLSQSDDSILEAMPGGARVVTYHYSDQDVLWSTDNPRLALSFQQKSLANSQRKYKGVDYSFMDYLALATHTLGIPAPGLREGIASTGHMICSQLVDQCRLALVDHLFSDNRWPGYVDPLDLAILIQGG